MWCKQGLIFAPNKNHWWSQDYALLPTVEVINDVIRVYFASLDNNKFGRIGFVDLDPQNPRSILNTSHEPILNIGEPGSFDDSGVNPSCIINVSGKKFLYYIGWQRCVKVPYMLFSGLAISSNGTNFEKHGNVPILDRKNDEPFSRSAPFIIKESEIFKMWYWSCVKWTRTNQSIHYNNVIKYATSLDGINWSVNPNISISPNFINEYSVGRPCVIKDNQIYKMWYSIRSHNEPYKIGYAESVDGIDWIRKDEEVGISRSQVGWDSEMICYPCVIDVNGKRYMFYNGNKHGSTGFGYAVWNG